MTATANNPGCVEGASKAHVPERSGFQALDLGVRCAVVHRRCTEVSELVHRASTGAHQHVVPVDIAVGDRPVVEVRERSGDGQSDVDDPPGTAVDWEPVLHGIDPGVVPGNRRERRWPPKRTGALEQLQDHA